MKIHALTTGAVRVKHAFLHPSSGPRRQLDLFLPSPWSEPLPIHCWAIEHGGRVLLVDAGEVATARNVPFARFEVAREQELPGAVAAVGLSLEDVSEVVLTHHHGDHVDGLSHARARHRRRRAAVLRERVSRVMRRVLRQPLPDGFAPKPFALDGGPFGAFAEPRAQRRRARRRRRHARATPRHVWWSASMTRSSRDAGQRCDRLSRAAQGAARRRDCTRSQGARRDIEDDPGQLRRASDGLPAVADPDSPHHSPARSPSAEAAIAI